MPNGDKNFLDGYQSAEIKTLATQMHNGFTELKSIMVNHETYHELNEAKWGLVKIMSLHPFKTFLVGVGVTVILFLVLFPGFMENPLVKVIQKLFA